MRRPNFGIELVRHAGRTPPLCRPQHLHHPHRASKRDGQHIVGFHHLGRFFHAHPVEHHLFLVLEGRAVFHEPDGTETEVGAFEGILVRPGAVRVLI